MVPENKQEKLYLYLKKYTSSLNCVEETKKVILY
jgi:hypothetical protein